MNESICEFCLNYEYDDEYGEYYCMIDMDEDDVQRFNIFGAKQCPYYHPGDEYTIVRKQN